MWLMDTDVEAASDIGEWLLDCKWSWFDHEAVKRGKQFNNWKGKNVLYQNTLLVLAFLV